MEKNKIKNILVINFSHRKNGSTSILIDKFMEELDKINNKNNNDENFKIELINLIDLKLEPFDYDNNYKTEDLNNFNMIRDKFLNSELIIFASPIYWYGMSGMGKVLFDRLFMSLFGKEDLTKNKNIGLLFTYGSDSFDSCFIEPFKKTSQYLKMNFIGYFGIKSKYPVGLEEKNLIHMKKFIEKIKKNLN
jgi:multimeric flavodoxin WrbA